MDTKNILNLRTISDNTSLADTYLIACQVDAVKKATSTAAVQVFNRLRTELRNAGSELHAKKGVTVLSDSDREELVGAFLFACNEAKAANAGLEIADKKKATWATAQSDLKRGVENGVLSLDDILAASYGQNALKKMLSEKAEEDKAKSEQALIEKHMKDKGLSSVDGGKPAGTQDKSDASADAAPAATFSDPSVQKAFDDLVAKMQQLDSLGEARNNKGKTAASKLVTLIETTDDTVDSIMKGFATAMEAIAKAS